MLDRSKPAAIALRSPYCLPDFPRTPQRTPRPHPLAQTRPTRSPVPEKTSLSRANHSPALTHPTPHTTHVVPTSAPFLPTNPPQSRNSATPLERYAQACYPRPREEPAPRPGNPTLKRGKAPGIRRGVPCGRPLWLRPPVLLCHAAPLLCPNNPRQHYRFARDRRQPQLGGAQNVAETNRLRLPAFAGITVLGAPSNLKQAPVCTAG